MLFAELLVQEAQGGRISQCMLSGREPCGPPQIGCLGKANQNVNCFESNTLQEPQWQQIGCTQNTLAMTNMPWAVPFTSLIFHLLNQGSTKRNLAWFWAALKPLYKTYQITDKYGSFSTTTMFMNKQGIKLKGKAAVIKALAKPLLEIWSQWHNPQLQMHRMISIYLKLNCQIEGMLEDNFANLSFSSLDLFDSFKLCLLLLLYRSFFACASCCTGIQHIG